jgi:hypothetical protein
MPHVYTVIYISEIIRFKVRKGVDIKTVERQDPSNMKKTSNNKRNIRNK